MNPSCDSMADISLQQSCPLCRLPDSNDMISCDECERCFHLPCAGVTENVNHGWSCRECVLARVPAPAPSHSRTLTGEPLHHQQSLLPPQLVHRLPTPVPTPRTPSQSPLNSKPPTPRPRTAQSTNSLPPLLRPPQSPNLQHASLSRTQQTTNLYPNVPPASSEIIIDPDLVKKLPDELRIQLLEEEEAIERKFLHRRFQLLLQLSEDGNQGNRNASDPVDNDERNPPVFQSSPKIDERRGTSPFFSSMVHQDRVEPILRSREQQAHLPIESQPTDQNPRYFRTIDAPRVNPRSDLSTFEHLPSSREPNATFAIPRAGQYSHIPPFAQPNHPPNASAFAPYVGLPHPSAPGNFPYDFHDLPSAVGGTALLNRSQIAARQAVPKELPTFTGEPEEWPLFFLN
nr:uncharacterized protein LOC115257862 [Aedes albopictus]